jgi:hypothetical protein
MDYVPQELGIYDTVYWEHTEHNCRKCHGNSLANRHHFSEMALNPPPGQGACTYCHPVWDGQGDPPCGDPEEYENGIRKASNCMADCCHATPWLEEHGWHHNTDMAAAENCIACHDPDLIEEITPFRDHETYPPSVVTPSPFSCENCHWEQAVSGQPGDWCDPGHPSTYEHKDYWGNFIEYYEYPKPIYGNFDTHHMGFLGDVSSQCYKCHSQDPNEPDWNPYNPELGRYCQLCHSMATLHRIGPHVNPHAGWVAVGFHVPEDNLVCDDVDPSVYRTGDLAGPAQIERLDANGESYDPPEYWGQVCGTVASFDNEYTADDQCKGCHFDWLDDWPDPEVPPGPPVIDTSVEGLQPIAGSCGALITIRGRNFGSEHTVDRRVEFAPLPAGTPIYELPVHAWTDTLIEVELPCWTFAPGNYAIRVCTEVGCSNFRVFTVTEHPTILTANPTSGPCGTVVTITGNGFDTMQSRMFSDGYHGVHHVVDFVNSSGEYTATVFPFWTATAIGVQVWDWFEDQDDTCGWPNPPFGELRNFVQDDGSVVPSGVCAGHVCPDEPTIPRCDCLALGLSSIYIKAVFFGDEDSSGDLSCGDTIFQIEKSDPIYWELTNEPVIYKLNPRQIERWVPGVDPRNNHLKIYGLNFGPSQQAGDEVRVGLESWYPDGPQVRVIPNPSHLIRWSSTLIRVAFGQLPAAADGRIVYVWVKKGGEYSNALPVRVLPPLP